jgi:hypothetical protein
MAAQAVLVAVAVAEVTQARQAHPGKETQVAMGAQHLEAGAAAAAQVL